ncbi:30S ribosomal protein S2 [Candidatus Roizmanbacteria bacterium RIFCSPLOWO2_12_FULL_40_12]|uniref:Small ribosomal subunit protein uS2 n=1 Tax=Candidatus Roizmanbacteria bacterium RIFCSPLOWO2_01_FULL_40_42 TaxID=1802066 RepID=A0A1F7J5J2_9BACT|nr:MAG: 30S ribosomal protein S2 [Candidatus Roizmanbacteria bacterium RIFCSPHIGHO2_01_FULL_40_98]OGK28324.1 MAG: 30S ribosomal protein S2 [Candidatus Roizmanbacteria bacterium RIFCSPHIGHO2_02_FULL_40_53]OGK30560.1 MAG: 30S ribosomal protein S2 [Candidatus Roizmanbacteria bacterium RIFCSPHIGHO2_12_41_18]OGK36974.1 MAG: 30S ribosomal protein S2 [Candidatus Roizmanbacteria bacterium RIFCSPHIGHO2_12_FULL_40_130]OGK50880.1 MAG: 30S ribosomal protein S2 [Candidatus Roizmanbacteria bacterium RIFCSPLO
MNKTLVDASEVQKLFEVGLHLGHKKNRLHPKARKFVYRIEKGVSIIDLTITVNQLKEAEKFLQQAGKDKKTLLIVATKKIAVQIATKLAREHNLSFVTNKWLPGLLTNFETIIKNVKKLEELKEQKGDESWEKLTKHEKGQVSKHIARLERFYGGLTGLTKKPDVIFVVDVKKEFNAVIEARRSNIPVVGIADTNADPEGIDFPIVANDDSPTAVEFLIQKLISAYVKG